MYPKKREEREKKNNFSECCIRNKYFLCILKASSVAKRAKRQTEKPREIKREENKHNNYHNNHSDNVENDVKNCVI